MKLRKTIAVLYLLSLSAFLHAGHGVCQDDSLETADVDDDALAEEIEWLRAETYVITASRVMEEIRKSAASVTVITDRQLRQMGARDLVDALTRLVPGVDELRTLEDYRCVAVNATPVPAGILYLIDNHPVNTVSAGATAVYADLPVDNIKRIEFVRGPGSAMYGANAFVGVVNVITKSGDDIDGIELTARAGSWDTQQYNLLGGKRFGELEAAGNFNYYKTHGYRGVLAEDVQTQLDRMYAPFFPPASLAPGYTKGDKEKYDAAMSLKFKGFTVEGKYLDKTYDTPASPKGALVDESVVSNTDYYVTLGYEASIRKNLDLNGRVYWNVSEASSNGQAFPPGHAALTPTGFAIWQDGWIRFYDSKSVRTGIEIQSTAHLGNAHTVVAGATYEDQEVIHEMRRANFLLTSYEGIFVYLPSVQEVPDFPDMGTKTGYFHAVFLEDLWDITRDLRLTTGCRYDRYFQFGGHLSPRIGLTWEYMPGYDVKLLYGHAFRAPTFLELFLPSDGNPELDPEKIDTYQVSIGGQFASSLNARITFSHREIKDLIEMTMTVPHKYMNGGKFRDQSVDLEMTYDFGRGTALAGNLTYTDHKDGLGVNFYRGKIWTNIRLSRHLNLYVDAYFSHGLNKRPSGDPKAPYPDHEFADATLIAKDFIGGLEGMELRASVYNLLDENWAQYQVERVPFDLPREGRNYLFELKYAF